MAQSSGIVGEELGNDDEVVGVQRRIRHITGIRIHQLTLPESIPLASKLILEPPQEDEFEGYTVGEHSKLSSSPDMLVMHQRRSSASHHTLQKRDRSTSNSTISPTVSTRVRTTRPRAPTLAGEALEHGHGAGVSGSHLHGSMDEQKVLVEQGRRRLARCFMVLRLPPAEIPPDKPEGSGVPPPRKGEGDRRPTAESRGSEPIDRQRATRTPSSTSVSSLFASLRPESKRPPLSSSSSRSSIPSTTSPRRRTTSLTSSPSSRSSTTPRQPITTGNNVKPLVRSNSARAPIPPALIRSGSDSGFRRPDLPSPRGSHLVPSALHPSLSKPSARIRPQPSVPFFISPIHHPSTHPRFWHLTAETDFAPWLTVEESAFGSVELEVWYEAEDGWKRLDPLSGCVDLAHLRRVRRDLRVPENTLQFTLSTDPKEVFYLQRFPPQEDEHGSVIPPETVRGIVERNLMETRMKEGIGVGGLHQLVNVQAVLAETDRGIEEVRGKIDRLLFEDADWRGLRRDICQREERVRWITEKVAEVGKMTREAEARITLGKQAIGVRRAKLCDAEDGDDLLRGSRLELERQIHSVESDRSSLQPKTHHFRAHHVQSLDALFPIVPLNPASLLYSILNVPLPIPIGPKDPAPPVSITGVKVDERTNAAALGYVALVVQILGNLTGSAGGLPYPVTCAGSRSLVKDVVSVMHGPRSFPLYTRGVERYRFEYAVFLLNKNIEMLMQEANIRLLELRHTLPNLKSLLLTLSSPVTPPSLPPLSVSGSSTYVNSRGSSRQTSRAWSIPPQNGSPSSSTGRDGALYNLENPSPARKIGRRSMLSRPSTGVDLNLDEDTDRDPEKADGEGSELSRSLVSTT